MEELIENLHLVYLYYRGKGMNDKEAMEEVMKVPELCDSDKCQCGHRFDQHVEGWITRDDCTECDCILFKERPNNE